MWRTSDEQWRKNRRPKPEKINVIIKIAHGSGFTGTKNRYVEQRGHMYALIDKKRTRWNLAIQDELYQVNQYFAPVQIYRKVKTDILEDEIWCSDIVAYAETVLRSYR